MENRDATRREERFPTQIMCIYATCDEPFYRELQTHLSLWEREGAIRWLETQAGSDVEQAMQTHLGQADLILLLISPSFFAHDQGYMGMKAALREQAKRSVPVVPVLARAFDWKESACGKLLALPENEVPIAEWSHPERAYENIRTGLARLIPGLSTQATTQKKRPRIFQARDLPRGHIPRPKVFDAIKSQFLGGSGGRTTAITTALRGAGGFGKTTLALALCHDAEIQAAFPDGIRWVELGENPPRPLDVLNGVLASLEPSRSAPVTLEEAQDRWRRTLGECRYLLVIDDVWQAQALSPLLEGGPHCMRLVTTRNDQVLPEEAVRLFVDAMESEEAIAVLCRNLPEEVHHASFQPMLLALAQRLGYWPLLLTLANSMLVAQVRHGRALVQALAIIEQAYETRGVLAFDPGNLTDRQRAVEACIEVSLRHLEEFTSPNYQAVERYQELAVFPEDTDIPLETLRRYWQGTGRLAIWEVDDLCMHLHDLSLLLTCDLSTNTVRLHDVLRSYLIQHAGSHLPALHVRLLDAHWRGHGLQRWADLPLEDLYLWEHLVWHLLQAWHWEEAQIVLSDLSYLTRKALYVGIPELESEALFTSNPQGASRLSLSSPERETLAAFAASLHRHLVCTSHLLRQMQTPAEMGGLLLSHLGWESAFAGQRHSFECNLSRPCLTAMHPLPNRSSSLLLRTLRGHTGLVSSCAVSPDGNRIVSASWDQTLKVWDATTGEEKLTLTGHTGSVNFCMVSPDGSFIVSASEDQTLKVWNAITGEERLTLIGHTSFVNGCVVSPDGHFITSVSSDQTLKVWNVVTGLALRTLRGHTSGVTGCAMSPDGKWIVSSSADKTLKIWDFASGKELVSLKGDKEITGCAVSSDGKWIISTYRDGTLKVLEAFTGKEKYTLAGHKRGITRVAVSPDGRILLSTSWDGTLKSWDFDTGAEKHTLKGHTNGVIGCSMSPHGEWIVSASEDHTLKVWRLALDQEQLTLRGHASWVRNCAMSPDGKWIVSASDDETLKIWDVATGQELQTLRGHKGRVMGCAISPDGKWIASASDDETLKIWDSVAGRELHTLSGHTSWVMGCAISPDGKRLISASYDRTLKVWDFVTGRELYTLLGHTEPIIGCAISPDGKWLVSTSWDKMPKVWDLATYREERRLLGHTSGINGCAISPDGTWAVSASWDGTLKVWELSTGRELCTLQGHTGGVNGCAVSPDSRFIISTSGDKTLKVWDARVGQCLLTFPTDGALHDCAFHPDGEHLVACGDLGMYFLRLVV